MQSSQERLPRRCSAGGRAVVKAPALLVEPHLLYAATTVARMVRAEVLHVRPRREVVESADEHRPHGRLFQFPLDLLHQRPALLRIQLLGLLVDEPRDWLVAEAGIVSWRPAAKVLVEIGVRVVRLHPVSVDADLERPARLQVTALRRIHMPQGGFEPAAADLPDAE